MYAAHSDKDSKFIIINLRLYYLESEVRAVSDLCNQFIVICFASCLPILTNSFSTFNRTLLPVIHTAVRQT